MKINVRHEGASEQEVEQTCVWVVGDDGETVSTSYLKPGEKVSIEVGGTGGVSSATGEVEPIAAPEAEVEVEEQPEQPPAPEGNTGENAGGDSSAQSSGSEGDDSAGAPGVQSGGQAGGAIAE